MLTRAVARGLRNPLRSMVWASIVVGSARPTLVPGDLTVVAAALRVTTLLLGYHMTHPLLAGIVTDLGPNKGQAMGLHVLTLFTGFGAGRLVFAAAMTIGLDETLVTFGAVALLAAGTAVPLFRTETARGAPARVPAEEATRREAVPSGATRGD